MFGIGALIRCLIKVIVLCFVYVFVCEGIDVIKNFIKCLTVQYYNRCTTAIVKKVEERVVIPYKRSLTSAGETINISYLVEVTPKIVADIDIMTGRIETKEVWKKRGLPEKFIHSWNRGMSKSKIMIPKNERVKKSFIYVQSLVNTLNFSYPNWQDLNPEFIDVLRNERIVAEEVIIMYLKNFKH